MVCDIYAEGGSLEDGGGVVCDIGCLRKKTCVECGVSKGACSAALGRS